MNEDAFRFWLANNRGYGSGTVSSRLSNCRTVELHEGDLDRHFDLNQLSVLLDRLTYSSRDERLRTPARHKIPIHGNVYTGSATLKSAVSLYKQFRLNSVDGSPVLRGTTNDSHSTTRRNLPAEPDPPLKPGATIAPVSAAELGDLRRKLVRVLVALERSRGSEERLGVGERIARLQRSGGIPREVAAMMRTITEMRNASEYQAKTLTAAESSAVRGAWEALQEWASGRGLGSPA